MLGHDAAMGSGNKRAGGAEAARSREMETDWHYYIVYSELS
jgi:hypothetical protein